MKPYYDHGGITIYHGDCREIQPQLPDNGVDITITDPPYNVGKNYGTHNDAMEVRAYHAWLAAILRESARISRYGLVYFPGAVNVFAMPEVLAAAGLTGQRLLGWHRKEFAGDLWTSGPAMSWEPVVWATRQGEKPYWNTIFGPKGRDFLVVPSIHGDPYAKLHPCPKPLMVMHWLVGLFVPEGGIVVDPLMGLGTTLRAAKDLGRRAIGIEIEERNCEIAARRLGQEVFSFPPMVLSEVRDEGNPGRSLP